MYFTEEQYERLTKTIIERSNDKERKEIYLSLGECEKYCEYYLSNKMKELSSITKTVIDKLENNKTKLDNREKYELQDLSHEIFVITLGTYNPNVKCSFKTFLYGNLLRRFETYKRDRVRFSRCNWEPKWDEINGCYKKDEDGKLEQRPVFDISMFSNKTNTKSGKEGCELWETFEANGNFVNKIIEKQTENKIEEYSDAMQKYLKTLSCIQVEILKLISNGFEKDEIIKNLGISTRLYSDSLAAIKDIKRTRILREKMGE